MSYTKNLLLTALTDAAAALWQMGATGAAHRAELVIAEVNSSEDDEVEQLRTEDRRTCAEFAEEGNEP